MSEDIKLFNYSAVMHGVLLAKTHFYVSLAIKWMLVSHKLLFESLDSTLF